MRRPPLALALLIMSIWQAQAADLEDWCKTATLPSSIVICGDPELRTLADERQRAFDEARARVGEEGAKALLTDQNGWVATYPVACGITQNTPPPNPVPDSVKECFKRAGQARIAYLRNYGTGAPSTAQPTAPVPPVRITKDRWWCPEFQRYYPEVQFCRTGTWQKITQQLDCRDAAEPDDAARCRQLAEEQADRAREEVRKQAQGPSAATATPATAEPPRAYAEGLADRQAWERYLDGLSGQTKEGAEYWAAHRSVSGSGCQPTTAEQQGQWQTGCLSAKRQLDPTDKRRHAEPDYRRGWNAYVERPSQPVASQAASPPPTDTTAPSSAASPPASALPDTRNSNEVTPSPPAEPNPTVPTRPSAVEFTAERERSHTNNSAVTYGVFIGLILMLPVIMLMMSTPERRKSLKRVLRKRFDRSNILAEKRWLDGSELLLTKKFAQISEHKPSEAYELVFVRMAKHHNPEYFPASAESLARAAFETRLALTNPALPSGLAPTLDEVFEPSSNHVRTKSCPLCAEEINAIAAVCPFCAYEFTELSKRRPSPG